VARAVEIVQADIDALVAAKATGALSVEYEGRKVQYRSLAELNATLADLDDELTEAQGNKPARGRRKLASVRSGY
jgi:hypothetical protein